MAGASRIRATICALLWIGSLVSSAAGQDASEMPQRERLMIAEAFRLAEAVQDSVWAGWSEAPFAVLLVTEETDYLVGQHPTSDAFTPLGYDAVL